MKTGFCLWVILLKWQGGDINNPFHDKICMRVFNMFLNTALHIQKQSQIATSD